MKDTLYIGIRGHRGSGRPTVSYLLAHTIDYLIEHGSFDENFDASFDSFISNIKTYHNDFILRTNCTNVYLESFSDLPRLMCAMILNIDSDMMYNEYSKDNILVNIDDLTIVDRGDIDCVVNTITAEDLFNLKMKHIRSKASDYHCDCYITLREFCTYYSIYCMQTMMCNDLWIRTLENSFFTKDDVRVKIFYDVKLPQEVSYIKNNGGYIVCANRPKHKKRDTSVSNHLANDKRIDFKVTIDGDDMLSCKEALKAIAMEVLKK